jgi:transposase-like protein
MPRIRYSAAVRDQAVRLVLESRRPIRQVARKFGCSENTLQVWLKAHRQGHKASHQADAKVGHPAVAKQEASLATFIPVNLMEQKSTTLEIVTPNGFTLKLVDSHPQ